MSNPRKGIRLKLSPARKVIMELMHHARKVPSLPLGKQFNLAALAAARKVAQPSPSWVAIFMRAYGLVAKTIPELRRAMIPWPYRHLYEHPQSECTVLIEREWKGENIIFGAKVRAPELTTLAGIDETIRRFKVTPVEGIGFFRQILRIGRLPAWLLRFTFWHTLYLSGYTRAKRLGTFSISSLGNMGVEQYHPLSPLTTYLTFGPLGPMGEMTVKIIYDHRVMDGRTVARTFSELEHVLQTVILAEVRALNRRAA